MSSSSHSSGDREGPKPRDQQVSTPLELERIGRLVEALRSNEKLPLCPYDRRSPLYWITEDDKPCAVCGQLNDANAPNLCLGADTRVMALAADEIERLAATLSGRRAAAGRAALIAAWTAFAPRERPRVTHWEAFQAGWNAHAVDDGGTPLTPGNSGRPPESLSQPEEGR